LTTFALGTVVMTRSWSIASVTNPRGNARRAGLAGS
jgi:hypothetical protein